LQGSEARNPKPCNLDYFTTPENHDRSAGWALFTGNCIAGAPVGAACDPSFGGKYVNLLRRISVPNDRQRYGLCRDYGRYSGSSWAGYRNLPRGYWTYKYPHWYIWGRRTQ